MTDSLPAPESDSDGPSSVASSRITEYLRAQILSGELAPGTRIRQEEVAQTLGASRLPVREALRMLQSQGLVMLKANSGAWVSAMDFDECQMTYKIRERLEPLALAESIPNLTTDTIDRLFELAEQIEKNDNLEEFLRLDRELHLLSYTGNPYGELRHMLERLWNTTQHYRRAYVQRGGTADMWIIHAEHRLLLDAIRRGDIESAGEVLTGHIRRTRLSLAVILEHS